jgi:hypothetical protein
VLSEEEPSATMGDAVGWWHHRQSRLRINKVPAEKQPAALPAAGALLKGPRLKSTSATEADAESGNESAAEVDGQELKEELSRNVEIKAKARISYVYAAAHTSHPALWGWTPIVRLCSYAVVQFLLFLLLLCCFVVVWW